MFHNFFILFTGTYKAAEEWDALSKVVAIVFDTSSNTGWQNGACTLLELLIKKKLMWLACRHHVYKRFFNAIFTHIFGKLLGLKINFSKRSKKTGPILIPKFLIKFLLHKIENLDRKLRKLEQF